MGCSIERKSIEYEDGTTREEVIAIVCRRGGRRGVEPPTCLVCHRTAQARRVRLHPCAYPLWGEKAGQTCGRVVCTLHAAAGEAGALYCPAHGRVAQRDKAHA